MKRQRRTGTAGHRRQHFVAQSYLRAWCDADTPAGQEPYVWRFNKDGSNPRRKAPENIFFETDLYTIHRADGERDLELEHGLAGLEHEFVAIRDTKLSRQKTLTRGEHAMLCTFIAAAHARTPAYRDHLAEQWRSVLQKTERMMEWAKTATPDQRRAAALSRPFFRDSGRPSLGYKDVKRLAEKPMQTMLVPLVQAEAPHLTRLDCLVMITSAGPFITSDYPCVWFDPEAYKRPPMYQMPGIGYKSIEISMPVSPRQLILLNRRGLSGYLEVPEHVVDEYNRRTRFCCAEHFVSNANVTKAIWFDPGEEPEDSWRKTHPAPPERELDGG
jgi:hypothetical protein